MCSHFEEATATRKPSDDLDIELPYRTSKRMRHQRPRESEDAEERGARRRATSTTASNRRGHQQSCCRCSFFFWRSRRCNRTATLPTSIAVFLVLAVLLSDQFYRHTRLLYKLAATSSVGGTETVATNASHSASDNMETGREGLVPVTTVPKQSNNGTIANGDWGFGACLLVKQDNDLLYEWLAYHYTVLPLRFVVIGSDVGNTEDPNDVLRLWRRDSGGGTLEETTMTATVRAASVEEQLQYWVLNASDFVGVHGLSPSPLSSPSSRTNWSAANASSSESELRKQAHNALIHRQKKFVTACLNLLKGQAGVRYVTLIDSDEFLVMNRFLPTDITEDDNEKEIQKKDPDGIAGATLEAALTNDTNWTTDRSALYRHRRELYLPPLESNETVLDVIRRIESGSSDGGSGASLKSFPKCYTMPRLLVGALENRSCSHEESKAAVDAARRRYRYDSMSTLRFVQHAAIGDFASSKFGKVMIDLSRLDDETLRSKPKNIHRPYVSLCRYPFVNFDEAYFYVQHYLGSWERYRSRSDHRRSRLEFEQRALLDSAPVISTANGVSPTGNRTVPGRAETMACRQGVYRWFRRFEHLVGPSRAKRLLGSI